MSALATVERQPQHRPATAAATSARSFAARVRALLMTPLMSPAHEDFAAVRRQADALRDWFARETGWALHVEREGARLYKRPADLAERHARPARLRPPPLCAAVPGLRGARTRRPADHAAPAGRAAAAVRGRADARRRSASRFTLSAQHERRELVAVCRTLAGARACCSASPATRTPSCKPAASRPTRSTTCSAARSPACWRPCADPRPGAPEEAPVTLDERLRALVDEHVADSEEGRRTALRHQLARRLLDDPVVYVDDAGRRKPAPISSTSAAPMAARLCEATGLVAEQRAEGLALVDEAGVADRRRHARRGHRRPRHAAGRRFLASRLGSGKTAWHAAQHAASARRAGRRRLPARGQGRMAATGANRRANPAPSANLRRSRSSGWRSCSWSRDTHDAVRPLPALARFALGEAEIRDARETRSAAGTPPARPVRST